METTVEEVFIGVFQVVSIFIFSRCYEGLEKNPIFYRKKLGIDFFITPRYLF